MEEHLNTSNLSKKLALLQIKIACCFACFLQTRQSLGSLNLKHMRTFKF